MYVISINEVRRPIARFMQECKRGIMRTGKFSKGFSELRSPGYYHRVMARWLAQI